MEIFETEMMNHIRDVHLAPAETLMRDTTELTGKGGQKYRSEEQTNLLTAIHAFDPECRDCQNFKGNPDPVVVPVVEEDPDE